MTEDTHFTVGREFVAIHALLTGADRETSGFTYPCGNAVHELATSAIQRLDKALKEDTVDDYEIHLAKSMLAAISMLALVGYTAHTLNPDGCESGGPNENPFTPRSRMHARTRGC